MLALFRLRPNHATVVAYLALFIALGGGAYAASSFVGPDGKIHSCVGKGGRLSVLKPGKKCAPGKSPLAWNQQGQQGPPGKTGPQGPGAQQFDLHAPEATSVPATTSVNGLTVVVYCATTSGAPTDQLYIEAGQHDVGVSGFAEANGSFEGITSQTTADYALVHDATSGGLAVNMDVLARDTTVNKWTHFVIGSYNDGTGNGCGIWGNVTPPSGDITAH